jgi:CBS domain containing-hemolysin-like protein
MQALFAAGEMAHVNANPAVLAKLAAAGQRGAARALKLSGAPERLLTASLLGSGLSITLATFSWDHAFGQAGLPHWVTALVAVPVCLTTEVLAKSLACRRPELLAPLLSAPLKILGELGRPLYALTRRLRSPRRALPRSELALILRERAPGAIAGFYTALRLNRLTTARAARPLSHLAGLPEGALAGEVFNEKLTAHSRLALLDGDGRPTGAVISVKRTLDLTPETPVRSLAQQPLRIPESQLLSRSIEEMRDNRAEFVFLTRGGVITGFTTQYDCSRLLLRELPQE